MHQPPTPTMPRATKRERAGLALGGAIVVLVVLATNANTLSVPFLFDDTRAITDNPTIRHLGALRDVLSPPHDGSAVMGRPLVNLSLAINYAIGGTAVRGYHAFNLLLHICTGLALFGVARRTLLRPGLTAKFGAMATELASVVSLLWMLHPLQTESVTCVVQRTELLVGLFYVLTLYCFVRSTEPGAALDWAPLAVASCALGMASKEVMVTAPLMVLLYDRTFVAGSFRDAWRARRTSYLFLGGTWLVLAALLVGVGGSRGAAAGFGLGISPWAYALKQCEAIVHYLRLSVWPHPLVLDYGTDVVTDPLAVAPQALLLAVLVAGTCFALWRRPVLGFLGAWFFVILAPSSSVVPLVTQTMAEHRMYLPLAGVLALAGGGVRVLAGRRSAFAVVVLAFAGGALTVSRNAVYHSELSIWRDTVARRPENARAQTGVGLALFHGGQTAEAMEHLRAAVRLKPGYPDAHYNLGLALFKTGQTAAAMAEYETALQLRPAYAEAHYNLGLALMKIGRVADAIAGFEAAVQVRPDLTEAHNNLGAALARTGRLKEALPHFEAAVRLDPANAEAHNNLGMGLRLLGNVTEARRHFEEALRLQPDFPLARENLARLLAAPP